MKTVTTIAVFGMAIFSSSIMANDKWNMQNFDLSKLPPVADKQGVTYANDIQPLFAASCVRCHGEERSKGELRLDSLSAALKGGQDGKVVTPGDGKNSLLVVAVAQLNNDTAMPPKHGPGGHGGPGGPGGGPPPGGPPPEGHGGPGGGGFGPPPKPFTAGQVGLIRAWIDQGAR